MSRATTPNGGTGRQRQWTSSISQIRNASKKPTSATHLGPSWTTSQQRYGNQVRGHGHRPQLTTLPVVPLVAMFGSVCALNRG
jgi:hypothetical protein